MWLKLKMVSDEVDGFLREYEVDSEATFLDLNSAILESCGYPDDQMTSFYVCNDEWERGEQITREDMGNGSVDVDVYVMAGTRISEFLDDKGQKLEFVFDPFSERSFFLNVRDVHTGMIDTGVRITRQRGDAPVHIAELSVTAAPSSKMSGIGEMEEDEDYYGFNAFNDDEIDPEAFEISQTPY